MLGVILTVMVYRCRNKTQNKKEQQFFNFTTISVEETLEKETLYAEQQNTFYYICGPLLNLEFWQQIL